jgi:mitochondrial import receptor subunit TOM70
MSSGPSPNSAPSVTIDSSTFSSSSSSIWGRISQWTSDNRALVYTIAGIVVVVTGAGAVYYYSLTGQGEAPAPVEKVKGKKDRRKEKKKAEEGRKAKEDKIPDGEWMAIPHLENTEPYNLRQLPEPTKRKVEEPPEELPDVDEESISSLSEEVCSLQSSLYCFTNNSTDEEGVCS